MSAHKQLYKANPLEDAGVTRGRRAKELLTLRAVRNTRKVSCLYSILI